MKHNTIIIGAGPAGIATAIQLRRAGHDFLLLDKGPIGGLLNNAHWVENYPGFPDGLTGPELVERLRNHLDNLGIDVVSDEVLNIDQTGENFSIATEDSIYHCKNLVVASGTKAKELESSSYDKKIADKIHYKVYPLKGLSDKDIAIVGGGDAAFDFALNLSGNRVAILYRESTCLPLLYKRAVKNDYIRLFPKTEVTKIEKLDDKLAIETANPYHRFHYSDLVIAAIGRRPCIDFLSPEIKNHFLENRAINGLFYPGDVSSDIKRQVAIAVGDGIKTAMEIIRRGN